MKFLRSGAVLLAAFMLIFAQTAPAAESTSSFNWTGPYLGAHIGYGWGNADTGFSPLPSAARFAAPAPVTLSPDPGGIVGGLHGGYNYQMGRFVVGIEAGLSGSGISGTRTVSPIIQNNGAPLPGGAFLSAHQRIDWFGTLRPRFGFTVTPSLLVYGTGGLAYGGVSYSAITDFRPSGGASFYPASFNSTKFGWTLGGGLEYAILKNWTVRTEYLYMDLGSESAIAASGVPNPPFRVGYNWQTTAHILNIGVNYKF